MGREVHSPCWRIWRRGSCAVIGWRQCSGQRADCRGRSEHPPHGSGKRSALTPLGKSSLGKANLAAKWGVLTFHSHSLMPVQMMCCLITRNQKTIESNIFWTTSRLKTKIYPPPDVFTYDPWCDVGDVQLPFSVPVTKNQISEGRSTREKRTCMLYSMYYQTIYEATCALHTSCLQ